MKSESNRQIKPKSFIFDLGNVIIDIDYNLTFDALYELCKNPNEETKTAIHEANLAYEQGQISTELFLNKLIKWMRYDVHARQVIDAWNAMLLDIPLKRLKLLEALKKTHNVLILSNTNALHVEWVDRFLQKHYEIKSFYEITPFVYYSHEVKDRKPKASIYKKLLEHSKIDPNEALFFDDKEENVEAAKKCGINAVLSPADTDILEQIQSYIAKT